MYSVVDIMEKMHPDWAEYLSAYEICDAMNHYYGINVNAASKERLEYVVTRLKALHTRRKNNGYFASKCLPFKAVLNPSLSLEALKQKFPALPRRVVEYNKKAQHA